MYYTCYWLCNFAQTILNILKASIPFLKEFINDRLDMKKNNHRIYIAYRCIEKPPIPLQNKITGIFFLNFSATYKGIIKGR